MQYRNGLKHHCALVAVHLRAFELVRTQRPAGRAMVSAALSLSSEASVGKRPAIAAALLAGMGGS
eukprot:9468276-Alexandrium_andersonii.AAC.1